MQRRACRRALHWGTRDVWRTCTLHADQRAPGSPRTLGSGKDRSDEPEGPDQAQPRGLASAHGRQIARIHSATWAPPRASGSRLSWEGLGAGWAMLPPILLQGLGCLEGTTLVGVPGGALHGSALLSGWACPSLSPGRHEGCKGNGSGCPLCSLSRG